MLFTILIIIIAFLVYVDPMKRGSSSLHLLQLEGYDIKKYEKWLKKNKEKLATLGAIVNGDKTPLKLTDRAKRTLKMYKNVNIIIYLLLIIISVVSEMLFSSYLLIQVCLFIIGLLFYFLQPETSWVRIL